MATVNDIITRITEAETAGAAYAVARSVPRRLLLVIADQLHINYAYDHGTEWVRWAVVKEARA
jgi:hypothetical protein